VAELRRLLPALREPEEQRNHRLWWSRFRRRHQAIAKRGHMARRARQAPLARPPGPPPLQIPSLPELTPERWALLAPLVPSRQGRPIGDARLMVEGILWVMRTGGSWRALPERFGPWSTVADCYRRWRKEGVWDRIRQALLAPAVPLSSSA
jgi:hypothetical protein